MSGLTALYLWESDRFAPVRKVDTVSYEHPVLPQHREHDADLEGEQLLLALGSTRTLLYPIFLDLMAALSPDYAQLPRVHWFLFTLAVVFFWYATVLFSGSRWFAFAVALPLLFPCWIPYLSWVMPEALSATFTLLAFASLLLLAKRPSSRLAWIGLTAATLLAYHTKPSLQILVVLLPLLAVVLRLWIEPRHPRALWRWVLGVATATALPLLLFCTLRLAVVGQFGLVAFTGYNVIGVAISLLNDEVVASLPEEHRPLADLIVRERKRRAGGSIETMRRRYVDNQWRIAAPAALQIVAAEISSGRTPEAELEPINMVIDRKLSELSTLVLKAHPRLYLKWVTDGFRYGLGEILRCPTIYWLNLALLLSFPVAWTLRVLRRKVDDPGVPAAETGGLPFGVALSAITFVAVSYYLGSLVLIVLVSWPMERYLALARLLLPSVLGGALFTLWAPALRGFGWSRSRIGRRRGSTLLRLEVAGLAVLALGLGGWWLGDRLAPALRADWIWVDPASHRAGVPVEFFAVRDFQLRSAPRGARLLIRADEEYRLFVNKVLVGSGRWAPEDRLDAYEVGDLLKNGGNRIVVGLRSASGKGGFLCRLDVSQAGRKRQIVVSDSDWRIVRRLGRRTLRPNGGLRKPTAAVVVPSRRRWSLRAGPSLPRLDEVPFDPGNGRATAPQN